MMPIKSRIRTVPHYPKQGVMFRDITTLLKDPVGFRVTINELANRYAGEKIDFDLSVGIDKTHAAALRTVGAALVEIHGQHDDRALTEGFLATGATAVAYETLRDERGRLPLLIPMSEVAGRMAIQEAAKYLEMEYGGDGVLLGGVPGVEPATVLVIGAGGAGKTASDALSGL